MVVGSWRGRRGGDCAAGDEIDGGRGWGSRVGAVVYFFFEERGMLVVLSQGTIAASGLDIWSLRAG